eukprot:Rmarinus@m.12276
MRPASFNRFLGRNSTLSIRNQLATLVNAVPRTPTTSVRRMRPHRFPLGRRSPTATRTQGPRRRVLRSRSPMQPGGATGRPQTGTGWSPRRMTWGPLRTLKRPVCTRRACLRDNALMSLAPRLGQAMYTHSRRRRPTTASRNLVDLVLGRPSHRRDGPSPQVCPLPEGTTIRTPAAAVHWEQMSETGMLTLSVALTAFHPTARLRLRL